MFEEVEGKPEGELNQEIEEIVSHIESLSLRPTSRMPLVGFYETIPIKRNDLKDWRPYC